MKLLTMFTILFGASVSLAGTGVVYKNESLNFTFLASAMTDDIAFCNYEDTCLEFKQTETVGDKQFYKEVNGKCEISVQYFAKDFAEGKTPDDYMLYLMANVVQVTSGKCELMQELPKQLRSLTGLYN